MAPVKENPNLIIPIALVALGIIAGYLFYSQSLKGDALDIPPPAISSDQTLSKFKSLNLDFSVFDDFKFRSLKVFGESPVQPGPTGRVDIFAPF
jgi:hypothetical protein